MSEWKSWTFGNIEVHEVPYNYSLHAFAVWDGDDYLGGIYPSDIEDMEQCIKDLDNGSNPIEDGWEDGCGNTCNLSGWGLRYFIDGEEAYESWKEAVRAFEDYRIQLSDPIKNYYVRSGVYRGVRVWCLSDRDGTKIDKESIDPSEYWEENWDEEVEVEQP